MDRHWTGGSKARLQSTSQCRQSAQREFFQEQRKRAVEPPNSDLTQAGMDACKNARSVAEMAVKWPSNDLKFLASLSETSRPSSSQSQPIAQPTAIYPTAHPTVFTSVPPNRSCSLTILHSSSHPQTSAFLSSPSPLSTTFSKDISSFGVLDHSAPYHPNTPISTSETPPLPSSTEHNPLWSMERPSHPIPGPIAYSSH